MKKRYYSLLLACVLCLSVSFANAGDGTGVDIDQRLSDLRNISTVAPLISVPTDFSLLPPGLLGLLSWNVQVGALSTSAGAPRPARVQRALHRLFAGSCQVLAVQEVSGPANARLLSDLLPTPSDWNSMFFDSTSAQDNGLWARSSVAPSAFTQIFVAGSLNQDGRTIPDSSKTTHPPIVAHLTVGNFDFTVVNVHLTYASGDTGESARELSRVLDYLDHYFDQPGHDPDVIILGDFNIPSRLSGQTGRNGIVLESILDSDPRFQVGERRLVATVHEPTSRSSAEGGGLPRNNYDHFILSADVLEEFVQARRVQPEVLTADDEDPELRLTSDHFPVIAFFRTEGDGVALDSAPATQRNATITSVVQGASFGGGIASGSWVTIFGTELASGARIWRNEEIVQGQLPTALDGIHVAVNGLPASVYFISPSQINIQAPDIMALGPVTVEVFRNNVKQAQAIAQIQAAAPGFFMFDPLSRRYPAAVHADGTLLGPTGLFGDALPTRPAMPGDVILLFGTGFGPTDPEVPAGMVFAGAAPLHGPVRVLIGGMEADVQFAGLTGAGLHQLNIVVPAAAPSGDLSLVAETLESERSGVFLYVGGKDRGDPNDRVLCGRANLVQLEDQRC